MKYMMFVATDTDPDPSPELPGEVGAWLADVEGSGKRLMGDRLRPVEDATTVRVRSGALLVTDGPFTESKEVIGGYALLRAGSKAEVVELCRKFLKVVGQGTCEVHELFEQPAAGGR
jgi:hypothetical protein